MLSLVLTGGTRLYYDIDSRTLICRMPILSGLEAEMSKIMAADSNQPAGARFHRSMRQIEWARDNNQPYKTELLNVI